MSDPILTPGQFEEILPLATAWVEEQEKRILGSGIALTPVQTKDARAVGVAYSERVRLLIVEAIPMPDDPTLRAVGDAMGLVGPFTAGMALRYGIYVRGDHAEDRELIAHELVHTSQYERYLSIPAFLRQYLHECVTIGYPEAPLEQEAITVSGRIL